MTREDGVMACLVINFICSIAVVGVLLFGTQQKPNYEAQANCIAEYDYTHPQQSRMDNLEAALRRCR